MTRTTVAAAGVSVLVHLGALAVLLNHERIEVPAAVRTTPVEMEVMRVTGIVSTGRAAEPTPAPIKLFAAHPEPQARRPATKSATAEALTAAVEAAEQRMVSPVPAEGAAVEAAPGSAEGVAAAVEAEPAAESDAVAGSGGADQNAALDTSELSRRLQAGALRCYPSAARRFAQTGEAQVRFCLGETGGLGEVTIASSSGSQLLDRAATGCVVPSAAPFGAQTFGRCFTVPVRFR